MKLNCDVCQNEVNHEDAINHKLTTEHYVERAEAEDIHFAMDASNITTCSKECLKDSLVSKVDKLEDVVRNCADEVMGDV